MIRAAVVGFPISHTLSPRIFSFLATHLKKTNLLYEAQEIAPEFLESFLLKARNEYIGFNVTIPHKEEVMKHLDLLAPETELIGACNCVSRKSDSNSGVLLMGHNTDSFGFAESLKFNDVEVQDTMAIILGAGGAARAVAYALAQAQAKQIIIVNRNINRAQKLTEDFLPHFKSTQFTAAQNLNWQNLFPLVHPLSIIANCTPLGMQSYTDSTNSDQFFENHLHEAPLGAVAVDLIYRPRWTPFLLAAKKKGWKTLGGMDMLISQALASWEIWFGPIESTLKKLELVRSLKAELEVCQRIFLTGFMGIGKTTTGRQLAEKLGWKFIDTDEEIEKKTKRSVGDLFESFGETAFRKIEAEVISEAAVRSRVVVALGGGSLVNSANLRKVKDEGLLIYLSAPLSVIESRLSPVQKERPLLKRADEVTLLDHIAPIFKSREPLYKLAHWELDVSRKSASEVAESILEHVQEQI